MQKKREYLRCEDKTHEINNILHFDFIKNYQKSILMVLVEKGLLTSDQYKRCIEELECQKKESSHE